jgi:hypothetical protein
MRQECLCGDRSSTKVFCHCCVAENSSESRSLQMMLDWKYFKVASLYIVLILESSLFDWQKIELYWLCSIKIESHWGFLNKSKSKMEYDLSDKNETSSFRVLRCLDHWYQYFQFVHHWQRKIPIIWRWYAEVKFPVPGWIILFLSYIALNKIHIYSNSLCESIHYSKWKIAITGIVIFRSKEIELQKNMMKNTSISSAILLLP